MRLTRIQKIVAVVTRYAHVGVKIMKAVHYAKTMSALNAQGMQLFVQAVLLMPKSLQTIVNAPMDSHEVSTRIHVRLVHLIVAAALICYIHRVQLVM